jgi:hypothetical protein
LRIPGWVRIAWGVALLVLNALLVAWVVLFAAAFRGPHSFLWDHFFLFIAVSMIVGMGGLCALAASFVHLFRSDLKDERRLLWAAAMLIGTDPAMLVYWFVHVRSEPARPLEGAA